MKMIRWGMFFIGLAVFSLGISTTINVNHLGLHPWDVLSIAFFDKFGLSIGSWNIIIGVCLITVSFILDRSYVRIGTFLNAMIIGSLIDFYLWLDFLPKASYTWTDSVIMMIGIVIMGVGGGVYNAAGVGSGPRDGFMLSISDKTGMSVQKVRIITELIILVFAWLIGGVIFVFTFLFTFIQSPIFQFVYMRMHHKLLDMEMLQERKVS
ncbi:MAG TPA: YitT family protein [Pseudogracilibacillus sp.]|nr:YitT family protein [Pseudogracilibacillus sp.]